MSLRTLNLSAAILHYTLAFGFSLYFINQNKKFGNDPIRGVELSMRDHNLEIKDDVIINETVVNWTSSETVNLNLKVVQTLLISFFIVTGTFHLMYFIGGKEPNNPTITNFYSNAIENKNNYFRWIEYSITATIMLYIIALTSGVKDTNVYILLFAISVTMISLGQSVEVAVRDGKNWFLPMITGFLLLISAFIVIIRSFRLRIKEVNKYLEDFPLDNTNNKREKIPSWLNIMIIILFIFYSCFGIVSLVGAIKHTNYEKVEKAYIILSFVSKAVLASFIAYGTAQWQQIK